MVDFNCLQKCCNLSDLGSFCVSCNSHNRHISISGPSVIVSLKVSQMLCCSSTFEFGIIGLYVTELGGCSSSSECYLVYSRVKTKFICT